MQRQAIGPFTGTVDATSSIAVPLARTRTVPAGRRRRAAARPVGDVASAPAFDPVQRMRQHSASHWLAEVRVRRADSRERRGARIDAAARAGASGVHAAADVPGGATLCGAGHVELASRAAELGLSYGVVPRGPRAVSLTEPWADYFLLDVRGGDVPGGAVEPDAALCRELAASGRSVWIRPALDVPPTRIEAVLHAAVDRLIEHGARRLVVVVPARDGARAAVLALRRTTGLAVGWSDGVADGDDVARAHGELGVRHFVVRLELEGEGREGTGFDPVDLLDLRTRLERERRPARAAVQTPSPG